MVENQRLELDRNPSPKDEAKDFQNADETLLSKNHAHELAMIKAKLGIVGKITGSTNDAMNTGLFIFICCTGLLVGSGVGGFFRPDAFSAITDTLLKLFPAIVGYVIGTKVAGKEKD
jgi:hypothetical protein